MAVPRAEHYTIPELLACFLSREIEDGETAVVGANSPIPRAAVLLAHLTHGPNIRLHLSLTVTNLFTVPVLESFEFESDYRQTIWAEAYYTNVDEMSALRLLRNVRFYVGALQVDSYGNQNLLGIGSDYKKLKFRGPGPIGTQTLGDHVKCTYILLNRHDRRTFVEKMDFRTAVGWDGGGADARKKLGLPGGGPRYCVTPLCIMNFEEQSKRMGLKSVHPGVAVDQVVENTGFDLVIPRDVPVTDPPTEEELRILRARIDTEGLLRQEEK